MTAPNEESQVRPWSPNPNETVPPSTAEEALEYFIRYSASQGSRAVVKELMKGVDASVVVLALNGKTVKREPTPFELEIATVISYCVRQKLLEGSPYQAIGAIETVKAELEDGGVFVGEERKKPVEEVSRK